jgi:uncharacterized protein GlcG (DUF336 family)
MSKYMNGRRLTVAAFATAAAAIGAVHAAGLGASGMPGDYPRPGDNGVMKTGGATKPPIPEAAPAPPIALALEAAQAIIRGCGKEKIGVVVANSAGEPILTYIPDGSDSHHVYTGIRKAYTAITFRAPTSALVEKAQKDADFAAKIQADPNFIAYKGGVLLKAGEKTIGAIAVSGSDHDEDCALIGVHAIEKQLK